MNTKHTPGPWHAALGDTEERTSLWAHGGHYLGKVTGNCSHSSTRETREADARLIAASPDLLAALQRLVIWDECGTSDDAVLDSIMSEARAAIAKAGQS